MAALQTAYCGGPRILCSQTGIHTDLYRKFNFFFAGVAFSSLRWSIHALLALSTCTRTRTRTHTHMPMEGWKSSALMFDSKLNFPVGERFVPPSGLDVSHTVGHLTSISLHSPLRLSHWLKLVESSFHTRATDF